MALRNGQNAWIRKDSIKWVILFFIFAFALRAYLSTMHVPTSDPITDQWNYYRFNVNFFEEGIDRNTRASTFVMAPLMLFFSWFGFDYLTGTILAGCLISALTIIPLWMISEHMGIYPKLACFLYMFSSYEMIRILAVGSYTTEFGILFFAVYILLLLRGYHKLAPFSFIIPFFSHRSSPLFIYLFLAFAGIFSVVKHKKIFNKDAKRWIIWSCAVFIIFGIIKFGFITPWWMSSEETLLSTRGLENAGNILMLSFHDYIEIAGSCFIILALLGLAAFYRENRGSVLRQSMVYAPQFWAFVPLFVDTGVSARIASYGAPMMCILAAYAFRNWSRKHVLMKILLVLMVIGTVYYTVDFVMFTFYTFSDKVWVPPW